MPLNFEYTEQLKKILVCPVDQGKLQYNEEDDFIECESCELHFPIDDNGIPILIKEKALNYK